MIKLKDILKENNFDSLSKEFIDFVWNRHPETSTLKPFRKEMSTKITNFVNQLSKLEDKENALRQLNDFYSVAKTMVDSMNQAAQSAKQSSDEIERIASDVAKKDIDLDNKNQETQKNIFDNTFRTILDNAKKSYSSLKDKEIVKKIDELVNIIYDNYNSKKYEMANNGAARLIAMFFRKNEFTLWKNEFTDANMPNTKTLEILDSVKDSISKGQ